MERKHKSFQDMLQQAQEEMDGRCRRTLDSNEVPLELRKLVSLIKRRAKERGLVHVFSDVDIARGAYFEEGPASEFCENLL